MNRTTLPIACPGCSSTAGRPRACDSWSFFSGFKPLVLLILLTAAASSAAQHVATPQSWPELTARLERAALAGSSKELRAIRADLLRRLTQPAERAQEPLLRYAVAYVGWRMATLPDVPGPEQKGALEEAVTHLLAVVKNNARNAEVQGLLGSVYGLQIAQSPMKGILLGPRASSALDRAAEAEPDNARVLLLQGVGAFNTPAMFGGGLAKAERFLRRSLELFAREPVDKPWPNWGRFDAHVWLGQALVKKGDRAGARAEYDKALAIAPGSGWLRYALIPALEK
jgi:tetratricopeptide (TPR) repeat protein